MSFSGYSLRVVLSATLVFVAVGLLAQTRREIAADANMPRIRESEMLNPLSRAREVRVRQVLALDPGNPAAVEMLAKHLVIVEKVKLHDGHLALIDDDSIRECLAMLERRGRVHASVPETTRLRAELHQLLAVVHQRRGEEEREKAEALEASRLYRRAIRELPEPRILLDEFYIGAILAAAIADDSSELIDVVQRMERDWRRYAINEWAMHDDVVRAYYSMGMYGHQVREMRYGLVWEAWNERVVPGMRIAAVALGQEIAVRNSLRSVRPRNHPERDAERLELLAELQTETPTPNTETSR